MQKFHLDYSRFRIKDDGELDRLLSNGTVFECAFENVKSEYKLLEFNKENLHLVETIQHVPGIYSKGKEDAYQRVPIKDVLKVYLEKQDILILFKEAVRKTQVLFFEDFSYCNIFRACPFFRDQSILHIHLYTDEFEIVNPLGSKSIHNVTPFYFTIGDLGPKDKSQLSHKHLCLFIQHLLFQRALYQLLSVKLSLCFTCCKL